MNKITLLDCTLRDGGYLNDWKFGKKATENIIAKLEETKVDILELGFIRHEPNQEGRVVFGDMDAVKALIGKKKEGIRYSVMAEMLSPIPIEELAPADENGPDLIRMIAWKDKTLPTGEVVDALQETYEYCEGLISKGYKICVQPVRVNQYSDEEFIAMLDKFAKLDPIAIYIVDSWGTDNSENLLHYMRIADEHLPKDIAIGYHGHNNMMHTMSVAQDMLHENFEREIIIDASVYGIGRGAGNLNLELIAKYLNERYDKDYNIFPMLDINEFYLKDIFEKETWGYSIPFFLTAYYKGNPKYARYLWDELHLPADIINYVMANLSDKKKVVFDKKNANDLIERYKKEKDCNVGGNL